MRLATTARSTSSGPRRPARRTSRRVRETMKEMAPRSTPSTWTTRSGSSSGSSRCTRSAARRWGATTARASVTPYGEVLRPSRPVHRRRLGDARPGRREPIAHHRRPRRPDGRPGSCDVEAGKRGDRSGLRRTGATGPVAATGWASPTGAKTVAPPAAATPTRRSDRSRSPRPTGPATPRCRVHAHLHRGDERVLRLRRSRPGDRRTARQGSRPGVDVPAHDHRGRPERFLAEPVHEARAEGWIESPALGGRLPVGRGAFNLFVPGDSPTPGGCSTGCSSPTPRAIR